MSLEEQLREKFARAVEETVKPPVLVGPKWLRRFRKGKPADFQYMGAPKIAKATGKDLDRVAGMLLKRVDLESMGLTARVTPDGMINIWKGKPPKEAEARREGKARPGPKAPSPAEGKAEPEAEPDSPQQ